MMKDLWKYTNKKKLIITYIVSIIYFVCEYGCSFAIAHYAIAPVTKEKILDLVIT